MKRTNRIIVAVLALAGLMGCEETNPNFLTTLQVSIADATITKATLDPASGKYSWEEGDEILVKNGQSSAVFTWQSGTTFTTSETNFAITDSYTVIYPASAYVADGSTLNTNYVEIPAAQTYDGTSVESVLLYAKSSKTTIELDNLMAVIEIPLSSSAVLSSVTLKSSGGKLAGLGYISDGALTLESDISDEITLTVTSSSAQGSVYFTLPAGAYTHGLEAVLTYADGQTESMSTSEWFILKAGVITLQELMVDQVFFETGDGTETSPYLIPDLATLEYLQTLLNTTDTYTNYCDKYYQVTAPIDMSSVDNFAPMANSESYPFKGVFDGGNQTISNLTMNYTGTSASGFFAYLDGATIKDVNFTNVNVDNEYVFSAVVAGSAKSSTIENVQVDGAFRAYGKTISVAAADYAPNTSNNSGYSGSIVGLAQTSTVKDCSFDGTVTIYGKFSGGIVGVSYNSTIENCSIGTSGVLQIYYHFTGGIVGRALGADNVITGCSFEGSLASTGYVNGGIVGQLLGGKVSECVFGSYGFVGGDKYFVGGIAGTAQPLQPIEITKCASYGRVRGLYSIGGIVGYAGPGSGASDSDLALGSSNANKSVTISDCGSVGVHLTATGGNTNGYPIAGGIIGWSGGAFTSYNLRGCYSLPGLIETTNGDNVNAVLSGISAYQNNTGGSTIENCYSAYELSDFLVCSDQMTDETLWYAAIAIRCTQATTMKNCFSESSMRYTYSNSASNFSESGCAQYSTTEMTDGTLLAALQSTANGTVWVAGTNGYPTIEGLPADPNVKVAAKKKVSVIGDSISTFKGYIPGGYSAHYPASDGTLTLPSETYWWRLIYDYMESAELDVNIAFSGSTVTNTTETNYYSRYTGSNAWWHNSYTERFADCGGCGNPDIILIHGGTNDWSHNVDPLAPGVAIRNDASNIYGGSAPSETIMNQIYTEADAATTRAQVNALPDSTFCQAYVKLLCQIRERYPECKVVCIIGDYLSASIEESVLQIAEHYGAKSVNLFRVNGFNDLGGYSPETLTGLGQPQPNMPKHDHTDLNSTSGCHPDAQCMEFMANKIYNELGTWLEN